MATGVVDEAGVPPDAVADAQQEGVEDLDEVRRQRDELKDVVDRLTREKQKVEDRLEFVEELIGPTEAQRKSFQDQAVTARQAALQASRAGCAVPVRFVGRLDERWLRDYGLSERDCALLQRGCVTDQDGVPRDVSLLGDPSFKPYHEVSKEPRWDARGGLLRLSLAEVRQRWGEEIALEVVRCASELDKHDASRRLGVELPWHESEERELEPAEVIELLERELNATRSAVSCSPSTGDASSSIHGDDEDDESAPSEASSRDLLRSAGIGEAPRAIWSDIESNATEASFTDEGRPTVRSPFRSPRRAASPDSVLSFCAAANDALLSGGAGDWVALGGTADDIEHLLLGGPRRRKPRLDGVRGPAGGRPGATPRSDGPSDTPSSLACGAVAPLDDHEDDIGEVLRELLEEEAAGPFGRLLVQTPLRGQAHKRDDEQPGDQ